MGEERRVWHVLFGDALEEDKPEGMVITAEEVLSQQQRADLMLLWKSRPDIEPAGCHPHGEPAGVIVVDRTE